MRPTVLAAFVGGAMGLVATGILEEARVTVFHFPTVETLPKNPPGVQAVVVCAEDSAEAMTYFGGGLPHRWRYVAHQVAAIEGEVTPADFVALRQRRVHVCAPADAWAVAVDAVERAKVARVEDALRRGMARGWW